MAAIIFSPVNGHIQLWIQQITICYWPVFLSDSSLWEWFIYFWYTNNCLLSWWNRFICSLSNVLPIKISFFIFDEFDEDFVSFCSKIIFNTGSFISCRNFGNILEIQIDVFSFKWMEFNFVEIITTFSIAIIEAAE